MRAERDIVQANASIRPFDTGSV